MSPQREPLVVIKGLKHTYKDAHTSKQVLHGIDLTIHAGSNIYLTGFSGSGKTTLISLLGCLRTVQEGSLRLFGEELHGANEAKLIRLRRRIGYVFQHFNLLDFMTIRQNVQLSLELQPDFSLERARERATEMLARVGLGDRVDSYPRELSGGQKQRVAIARALVHRPNLVLADEPTAALDSQTGREVVTLFQRLAGEQDCAVLVVTHNLRVLDSADEIIHMEDGRLGTAVGEELSLVFPTLDDRQLQEVVSQTTRRAYKSEEIIIRQGDRAEEFFLLLKGRVEVFREDENGAQIHIADLAHRGAYFGEMGLLSDCATRKASIRALNNVEVLVIRRDTFVNMMGDSRQTKAVIKDEMLQRMVNLD